MQLRVNYLSYRNKGLSNFITMDIVQIDKGILTSFSNTVLSKGITLSHILQRKVGREAATDPSRTFRFKVTQTVPEKAANATAATAKLISLRPGSDNQVFCTIFVDQSSEISRKSMTHNCGHLSSIN